jgi:hypothetical protein
MLSRHGCHARLKKAPFRAREVEAQRLRRIRPFGGRCRRVDKQVLHRLQLLPSSSVTFRDHRQKGGEDVRLRRLGQALEHLAGADRNGGSGTIPRRE